jgi:multicomponent K+:H+ antiporter subunit D
MSFLEHLPIWPILVPMIGGLLMLLPPFAGVERYQSRRYFAAILVFLQLVCGSLLLNSVIASENLIYAVGNWQPPFGIILYVDPLAALLVCLTSFLGIGVVLYSFAGEDRAGRYYHPLLQFQILGINGAFLTNDLFNLFVFFEVLLIASYSLLIHAGAKQKTEAAVHYVILNLIGSSIFLFALGTMYAAVGSLNIADIAMKISTLSDSDTLLVNIAGALLLVVFGLKSAMLPLHFWLPKTYSAASAPIAALFAIMTKVGIYCIFRVYTTIYGEFAGSLSDFVAPIIWPLALASIVAGTIGVIVSPTLRGMTGNLVVVSVGTLLIGFALRSPEASGAAFYYLIHSTLASAALFLLAEMIGQQRGKALDRFVVSRKLKNQTFLGFCFFVAAMMAAGLPPFSGFLGKLVILQAAVTPQEKIWVYSALLISSLVTIIAFSRAGTTLFWRHSGNKGVSDSPEITHWQKAGMLTLLAAGPLLAFGGEHMLTLTGIAASELHNVSDLIELMGLRGEQ